MGWIDPVTKAVVPPIHMASTYQRDEDNGFRSGRIYARADNPTFDQAEATLAALEGGPKALAQTKDYRGVTGDITMDEKRNASKPAVVLRVGKGGKYEFSGRIMPEGLKQSGTEAPAQSPKKTEGNTAPNPAPGNRPTPTPTPEVGATSAAQSAANTGQPQGVPAGEHPKK